MGKECVKCKYRDEAEDSVYCEHCFARNYSEPTGFEPAEDNRAELKQGIQNIIWQHLVGFYACNRMWQAWSYGTMTEEDFTPAENTELPDELAEAIMQELVKNE